MADAEQETAAAGQAEVALSTGYLATWLPDSQ